MNHAIAILDFGSQYTQLIAGRVAIRAQVGMGRVVCGLSGGVDSARSLIQPGTRPYREAT